MNVAIAGFDSSIGASQIKNNLRGTVSFESSNECIQSAVLGIQKLKYLKLS